MTGGTSPSSATETEMSANLDREVRRTEMLSLRQSKKWTLQKIADKYGISRERVRQIIGNSGPKYDGILVSKYNSKYSFLRDKNWQRRNADKTNKEISIELGVPQATISRFRGKIRHSVEPDSLVGVGAYWEEWVSDHLRKMGIQNELMPFKHPFDILAAGYIRIDVKSSTECYPPEDRIGR